MAKNHEIVGHCICMAVTSLNALLTFNKYFILTNYYIYELFK